jgi:L-threonylcarbamoyladenylate synthase
LSSCAPPVWRGSGARGRDGFGRFAIEVNNSGMRVLAVDPLDPDAAVLDEAAAVIKGGGVVAMPTDTLYGLAADPFSKEALAHVFAVKGRRAERALPLIAADMDQVTIGLGALPPAGRRLALKFWPGPLTLLVARPASLPAEATGGDRRVGVRVPKHAVARGLCRAVGGLLTATSANLSGEPASADPEEVRLRLGARLDLLLDAGRTAGGLPSTIVDVTGHQVRLVRAGAIPWSEVRACVDA